MSQYPDTNPNGIGALSDGLPPDQLHAIADIDKNLQIIACAGSGKTQVISERIVNTLRTRADKGVTPANIVAFTFTEKAAAELKDRIHRLCRDQLGSDQGLGDMYIGTIHGFCLNILQEPPLYRFLKYQVLSEVHQRLFIDRNSHLCGPGSLSHGQPPEWRFCRKPCLLPDRQYGSRALLFRPGGQIAR
jgi:ATP-dependent exoDNAse (exonuclease V) beta subunit